MMNKVADGIAVGAISSPWWLPTLYDVSNIAALLLPILGCIWLLIQGTVYIYRLTRKNKNETKSS